MSYGFHYFKGDNLNRVIKLQNKVLDLILSLNWDDGKIDVSKNWLLVHLITASQMAHLLALKRNQNWEIATATGVLHDIGLIVNIGMEKNHAVNGYDLAKKILAESGGFSEEETEMIALAASKHSEKDKIGNWLEELMKDVDVLDCALHGSDFSPFEHHYKRVKNLEKELGLKIN